MSPNDEFFEVHEMDCCPAEPYLEPERPAEVIQALGELSKYLCMGRERAEAYQHHTRQGTYWRIQIHHKHGVVRDLDPAKLDAETVYKMLEEVYKVYEQAIWKGKAEGVQAIAKMMEAAAMGTNV